MKNKKIVLGLLSFVVFLGVVYTAYNGLTSRYKNNAEDNIVNNQVSKEALDNKEKAQDFMVYDEEMKPVKLSNFEGTPVVLNFWATWCGYCKDEMPYFQEASEKYSDDQVKILMVNMTDGRSETKESAIEYMKSNQYTMKLLLDMDQEVAKEYRVSGIPRTIFIDKNGYIVKDMVGKIDAETLNRNIEGLINE